eukprot:1793510-Amphidinium_carterae.1
MAVEPSNRLHSATLGDRSDDAQKTREMMTTCLAHRGATMTTTTDFWAEPQSARHLRLKPLREVPPRRLPSLRGRIEHTFGAHFPIKGVPPDSMCLQRIGPASPQKLRTKA